VLHHSGPASAELDLFFVPARATPDEETQLPWRPGSDTVGHGHQSTALAIDLIGNHRFSQCIDERSVIDTTHRPGPRPSG
jgi:hypothetical protein